MIKINIASMAGFCMGVRRAVKLTLEENRKYKGTLYTHGALIHNPQIIDLLEQRGIKKVNKIDEIKNGKIIIRAHGVPPSVMNEIKEKEIEVLNATCPHVSRIHKIITKERKNNRDIIIVGDKGHAEVLGLEGCAIGNTYVVGSVAEFNKLPDINNPCVVAQTTQSTNIFEEIVKAVKSKYSDVAVYNTICLATEDRQSEIIELSKKHDLTIVVGGKISANTQRLVKIVCDDGRKAIAVENEDDLDESVLENIENVLIAAGASTPNWMISRIAEHIKKLEYRRKSIFFKWILNFFEMASDAYIGLGIVATFFAVAVWKVVGFDVTPKHLGVIFFYIVAMYTLNRLTNIEANQLQEVFKRDPINRFRSLYVVIAFFASLSALLISVNISFYSVLLVCLLEIAGILYNLNIIPKRFSKKNNARKIKDIPLSKDLGISLGWTAIIVLLPLVNMSLNNEFLIKVSFVAVIVSIVSFLHSLVSDIQDVQKDLFVGRETTPIHLGNKKVSLITNVMVGLVFVFVLYGIIVGILNLYAYSILLLLFSILMFIHLYNIKKIPILINLRVIVEAMISIVSVGIVGVSILI